MTCRLKQLQPVRRGLAGLVAVLVLAPAAMVWDSSPAASATQSDSSTNVTVVTLAGSSSPTLRAKVSGEPQSIGTPTGTVSFSIFGSGPLQCDDLPTDIVAMSGGVATCKVTSGLPASGSPATVQATYSGDGHFIVSDGSYTSNDGSFTGANSTPPPASSSAFMEPPAGYTKQQLIFDDQFSGTRLDTTKWNTYLGAQGGIWNDFGNFPSPYSGVTPTSQGGIGTDAEMYAPSQVTVDNGVTLTARRNTSGPTAQYADPSNEYSTWLSGVLTTEGKFSLPTTGWYVQAMIKMPDMTQGMWPSMWFLPAGPGAFNEIDDVQGGFVPCGGPSPNYCPVAAGYFDSAGNDIGDVNPNVGFDASAGYHVYGVQWIPGVGVKEYVDGNLVWSVTQAQVPGGIVAQAYEILLNLQVATSKDSGWRTVQTATSPSASMEIAEVQAYSTP